VGGRSKCAGGATYAGPRNTARSQAIGARLWMEAWLRGAPSATTTYRVSTYLSGKHPGGTPLRLIRRAACFGSGTRMRIRLALSCAAAVFVLLVAVAPTATATLITFTINMDGSQEVPPNASAATGIGFATFDDVANTIGVDLSFSGLSSPVTLSNIHLGAAGVLGAVIVSFVPPGTTSGSILGGPLAFPIADVLDLFAGDTYFNLHDTQFPGGEIRGQLIPTPEPGTLLLVCTGIAGIVARRTKRG